MDARGSPVPGRAVEQRKGHFPAAGHRILEDAPSRVSPQPLQQPLWYQLGTECHRSQPPNGTPAVPLAVSIVLAKLRLCRPLGLFSTCRLKAMIPDERAESPEWPCQRRQVSVPPRATAPGAGGSCRWDPALNISFHGCKLIPAQKLGTSVFQLVAS